MVFEFDETEEQHLRQQRIKSTDNLDINKNIFKNQPNQLKSYQKLPEKLDSKTTSLSNPFYANQEEIEKKK